MEDDDSVFLVLEYACNGSLFQKIKAKKKFSEKQTRGLFLQICEGVKYLHSNNIIHRDIKPENLLFDGDIVKIIDFGWCVQGGDVRMTFWGTLDYMAPEMIMGSGHSFKLDIWTLGILLYEMTHGYAPFTAKKEVDKAQQILNIEIKFGAKISDQLQDLIKKILQVEPEDRPTLD